MAQENTNLSKHFYSVIPIQELEKIEEVKGDGSPINKEGEDLIPIGLKNRENIANAISLAQLQSLIDTNTSDLAGESGAGLMSVEDKNKLDSITEATSAQGQTTPAKGGLMSNEDKEHLDWLYNNIDSLGIKNLKDGTATGSLRGVSTAEETDGYTLGQNTVILGENTKASSKGQTVIGRNNKEDPQGSTNSYGKYAFIVGNGTSESENDRSNAMTVAWNGDVEVKGNVFVNGASDSNNQLATISYTNTAIEEAEAQINTTINNTKTQINNNILKNLEDGEVTGSLQSTNISTASGQYSFAEGYNTEAIGDYSHTSGEGTIANNNNEFVIGSYNNFQHIKEEIENIQTILIDINNMSQSYALLQTPIENTQIICNFDCLNDQDELVQSYQISFIAGQANGDQHNWLAGTYDGNQTFTFEWFGTEEDLLNTKLKIKGISIKYNILQQDNSIFVIGNGTDNSHRSNALAVSKTGDLYVNGNIYAHDSSTGNNINLVDKIYPVGSIYMSVNNTDPSILFGGTWQRIQDRFLLAAGSTYNAGSTGGEATHKLTEAELPNIAGAFVMRKLNDGTNQGPLSVNYSGHFRNGTDTSGNAGQGVRWAPSGQIKGHSVIFEFGSNGSHNNMPPYLAVYIWQRIS